MPSSDFRHAKKVLFGADGVLRAGYTFLEVSKTGGF
jgi:hypothetical protein